MELRITIKDNNDNVYDITLSNFRFLHMTTAFNPNVRKMSIVWAIDVLMLYLKYYNVKSTEKFYQYIPFFDMSNEDLHGLIRQLFELIKLRKHKLHYIDTPTTGVGRNVRQFGGDEELSKFLRRIVLEDYFFINVKIQ